MLQDLINDIQLKTGISNNEIEIFKPFWKVGNIAKNDFLFRKGDVCRYDNYVVKGCLKAYYFNHTTGKDDILFFAIENWWATDLESFNHNKPSIYSIQALEDTELLQIDHQSFNALLQAIPKLEKYFRLISESYISSLQSRIIRANSFTAEENYRFFVDRYPMLVQRVPQYLIASYMGITPEFLSRIRTRK